MTDSSSKYTLDLKNGLRGLGSLILLDSHSSSTKKQDRARFMLKLLFSEIPNYSSTHKQGHKMSQPSSFFSFPEPIQPNQKRGAESDGCEIVVATVVVDGMVVDQQLSGLITEEEIKERMTQKLLIHYIRHQFEIHEWSQIYFIFKQDYYLVNCFYRVIHNYPNNVISACESLYQHDPLFALQMNRLFSIAPLVIQLDRYFGVRGWLGDYLQWNNDPQKWVQRWLLRSIDFPVHLEEKYEELSKLRFLYQYFNKSVI